MNTPQFLTFSRTEQKAVVEALIFASDEPLTFKSLFKLLISNEADNVETAGKEIIAKDADTKEDDAAIAESIKATVLQNSYEQQLAEIYNFNPEYIDELVNEINEELIAGGRPFHIVPFAGGYQFATLPEYGEFVHSLIKTKTKRRLSQAALETLAIIAYRQPITKPEIEQIRGVNSNEVVNSLIEKNFVKIAGRKEALGKPLLYATTAEFLKAFGLRSIQDIPKLRELDELAESALESGDRSEDVTFTITEEQALELTKAPSLKPLLDDYEAEMN